MKNFTSDFLEKSFIRFFARDGGCFRQQRRWQSVVEQGAAAVCWKHGKPAFKLNHSIKLLGGHQRHGYLLAMLRAVTKALAALVGLCAVLLVWWVGHSPGPSTVSPTANVARPLKPLPPTVRNGSGYVFEYELKPASTNCPVHGTALKLEYVPIIGGMFTPSQECDVPAELPFGRIAASSGSCVSGGRCRVFRCRDCVQANPIDRAAVAARTSSDLRPFIFPTPINGVPGARLWKIPESSMLDKDAFGDPRIVFYLLVLPSGSSEISVFGDCGLFQNDGLVFKVDLLLGPPNGPLLATWNRPTDTVTIGSQPFDLKNGNCFVIDYQSSDSRSIRQISNVPGANASDGQILDHFKSQLSTDPRIASLSTVRSR